MTVVEVYVGAAVDALVSAFAKIEWTGVDPPFAEEIVAALRGYTYSRGFFWLVGPSSTGGMMSYGRTSLPSGVSRVYGEYYVLGPSLVAMVLTFVLAAEVGTRIDVAVRNDAESRLDRLTGGRVSIKIVPEVKRERVEGIRDAVGGICRAWIKENVPGTLSGVNEGLGTPTCGLLSFVQGRPFEASAAYMTVLDLASMHLTDRFAEHEFLYLAHPISVEPNNRMIGGFNEGEAIAQRWVPDAEGTPEHFHEAISSLVIADGIYAVLASYGPKLRDIRSSLNRLDFNKAIGPEVVVLRNRLLGVSRDVAAVCSDVAVLVDDAVAIWADLQPLVRLKPTTSALSPEATAETKRRQLRAAVTSVQSQEANLRELMLVTSASSSETQGLELQGRVLGLTKKLGFLTTWLIVLTFILVALGVATLLMELFHTPAVTVHVAPPASGLSAP
jgi:hypothetical protein